MNQVNENLIKRLDSIEKVKENYKKEMERVNTLEASLLKKRSNKQ